MRKQRFFLIFLVVLGFGVSLAVPAEDDPETSYDESEALPYEGTPLFSITLPQASARIARDESGCGSPFRFKPSAERRKCSRENYTESYCVPVSLTIINHSLRC